MPAIWRLRHSSSALGAVGVVAVDVEVLPGISSGRLHALPVWPRPSRARRRLQAAHAPPRSAWPPCRCRRKMVSMRIASGRSPTSVMPADGSARALLEAEFDLAADHQRAHRHAGARHEAPFDGCAAMPQRSNSQRAAPCRSGRWSSRCCGRPAPPPSPKPRWKDPARRSAFTAATPGAPGRPRCRPSRGLRRPAGQGIGSQHDHVEGLAVPARAGGIDAADRFDRHRPAAAARRHARELGQQGARGHRGDADDGKPLACSRARGRAGGRGRFCGARQARPKRSPASSYRIPLWTRARRADAGHHQLAQPRVACLSSGVAGLCADTAMHSVLRSSTLGQRPEGCGLPEATRSRWAPAPRGRGRCAPAPGWR